MSISASSVTLLITLYSVEPLYRTSSSSLSETAARTVIVSFLLSKVTLRTWLNGTRTTTPSAKPNLAASRTTSASGPLSLPAASQPRRRVPAVNLYLVTFCSLPLASRTISVPSGAGLSSSSPTSGQAARLSTKRATRPRDRWVMVSLLCREKGPQAMLPGPACRGKEKRPDFSGAPARRATRGGRSGYFFQHHRGVVRPAQAPRC